MEKRNNYYLVITVEALDGEESTKLTEISLPELELLWPLLNYIKNYSGYFATGKFLKNNDPSPMELYSSYYGWNELISRLPEPTSGIKKISEIHVFSKTPRSLYM